LSDGLIKGRIQVEEHSKSRFSNIIYTTIIFSWSLGGEVIGFAIKGDDPKEDFRNNDPFEIVTIAGDEGGNSIRSSEY
jgi:hypothetical protein